MFDDKIRFWMRAVNGCYQGFSGLKDSSFTAAEKVGSVCLFASVNSYAQTHVVDRHLDCVTVPDAIWRRLVNEER